MSTKALVAGSTGIIGRYLTEHLVSLGWEVYALARNPAPASPGVHPIAVDLLKPEALQEALRGVEPNHVFFTSWLRQSSEELNCQVNGAMVENLLSALASAPDLRQVGLATGGKHYFGSFDEQGNYGVTTPFREEQSRKPGLNFYYTQEDILFAHAEKKGFSWNVHRPCTVVGFAPGNAMNMGTTLAVYASLCKETGRPFVFPGSPHIYTSVYDVVDARTVARQMAWAATAPEARNEAFNVANGDLFRWDWMWEQIADYFGLAAAPYPGVATPLVEQMKDAGPIWESLVKKHELQNYSVDQLAPWWHTDADLTRPFEGFMDLSKSREAGFLDYQKSSKSFFTVFDKLRKENIIP